LKKNADVIDDVIPAPSVRLPYISRGSDHPARVPVKPVQSRFRQSANVVTVTVTAQLFASKKTLSDSVGTVSPQVPPDVDAHLLPAVAFQLSEPQTQYLLAILI
jgi:hypothetical protein